jgi:hypothetical protein
MMKIPFSIYDFFGYLASGFAVLAALDLAAGGRWLFADSVPPGFALLAVFAAYVAGHAVAHLASVVFEHGFLRRVLRSPEEHLLAPSRSSTRWRWLFPGNFSPLPAETRDRVLAKAAAAGAGSEPRALFFHCHARVKRDEATLGRLNTFLNLYGFCRNLAMALLLSGFVLMGSTLARATWPLSAESRSSLLIGALCLPISYVLLLRYLKFFRHYTLEVFVSYAEAGTEQ